MKHASMIILMLSIGSPSLATSAPIAQVPQNSPIVTADTPAPSSDQYALLRQRWNQYFLGNPQLPMGLGIQQSIAAIGQQASAWLATLQVSDDGIWPDLPLDSKTSSGREQLGLNLYSTYLRLFDLARAYRLNGSPLAANPQLKTTLIACLTALQQNYYHQGATEWGDWWYWQVGIAKVVANLLVLLYDDVPSCLMQDYIVASRYFVPSPTQFTQWTGGSAAPTTFTSTGGNRTDNVQVVLMRGVLDQNPQEIAQSLTALMPVLETVDKGDGFHPDGSFIQHQDLPYTGTYGQVLVADLGLLMGLVAQSPWQDYIVQLQTIYPLLLESVAPLMVNGLMMDMVNGRAIARISGQDDLLGFAMIDAMLLHVAAAPQPYKKQLMSFIKGQIERGDSNSFFANISYLNTHQLAQAIMDDPTVVASEPQVSHRQFPDMNRVVHHRPDWSFGLAMYSALVGNYECINGENLQGWYTGAGMNYLYNAQQDHYSDYWPVVNPYRLTGTTVIDELRVPCSGQLTAEGAGHLSDMVWVGGSQLGDVGIAGMNFNNWNGQLQAKKSWFMLDDMVVSLGASIHNDSTSPALTTMANRRDGASVQVSVNGQPLLSDAQFNGTLQQLHINDQDSGANLGYIVLTPIQGKVSRSCQQGSWSDIGVDSGVVEGCFTTAVLLHSDNSDYAFILLPGIDQQGMDDFTRQPTVNVVANNSLVQAVEQPDSGLQAANFWAEAQAGMIRANSPISIIVVSAGNQLQVGISDPTRSLAPVSFNIIGDWQLLTDTEQRITRGVDGEIIADLSNLRGRSYSFTMQPVNTSSQNHSYLPEQTAPVPNETIFALGAFVE